MLWHRIAWQFGMRVPDLQASMTSEEFAFWQAYLEREPDAGTRADYLATMIAHLVNNVVAALGGRPPEIGARLIDWGRRPVDDERELLEALQRMGPRQ